MSHIIFAGFSVALLMIFYGSVVTIIHHIEWGKLLSQPPQEIAITILFSIIEMSILFLSFVAGLSIPIVLNSSIHIRERDFRITSFMYKSKWLTWDKIMKVQNVSPLHFNSRQIAIDGLGKSFKLVGLAYWTYPYGVIIISEKGMIDGNELLAVIKRKRRDLYY